MFRATAFVLALLLGAAGGAGAHEAVRWPAGQPTPDFELADAQGKAWKLSQARGKVVVLNFWASWCEPCRAEMPSLQQMADFYGPGEVVVLAVNFKEREARITQFAKNAALTLPMPMDRDGAVAAAYGVKIYPSTVVIGRDGKARWRVTGEVDWTGPEAGGWIDPLLKP